MSVITDVIAISIYGYTSFFCRCFAKKIKGTLPTILPVNVVKFKNNRFDAKKLFIKSDPFDSVFFSPMNMGS